MSLRIRVSRWTFKAVDEQGLVDDAWSAHFPRNNPCSAKTLEGIHKKVDRLVVICSLYKHHQQLTSSSTSSCVLRSSMLWTSLPTAI